MYFSENIKKNDEFEVGMFLKENVAKRRGRPDDEDVPEGWFNHIFEKEPTEAEAEEWVYKKWFYKNKMADINKRKRMTQMMKDENPELVSSRIITLEFDKKNIADVRNEATFTKAFCENYVREFKKSNYRWMKNGHMSFEFYGESGFHPHIHVYTETDVKKGIIALELRRKFVNKSKWKIWSVDVKIGTADYQEGYVHARNACAADPEGNTIIKCDDKQHLVNLDTQFRNKNNILHSYDI